MQSIKSRICDLDMSEITVSFGDGSKKTWRPDLKNPEDQRLLAALERAYVEKHHPELAEACDIRNFGIGGKLSL